MRYSAIAIAVVLTGCATQQAPVQTAIATPQPPAPVVVAEAPIARPTTQLTSAPRATPPAPIVRQPPPTPISSPPPPPPAPATTTAPSAKPTLSDAQIVALLLAGSRAGYRGNCPCPEDTDRAGRRCGGRSAYSKPGGAAPLCYTRDVSPTMIAAKRAELARK